MNIATLNKQHKLAKRYALALYKLKDKELLDDFRKNIIQSKKSDFRMETLPDIYFLHNIPPTNISCTI